MIYTQATILSLIELNIDAKMLNLVVTPTQNCFQALNAVHNSIFKK